MYGQGKACDVGPNNDGEREQAKQEWFSGFSPMHDREDEPVDPTEEKHQKSVPNPFLVSQDHEPSPGVDQQEEAKNFND